MGQAIKLVNSNFINRNIGIVHICKYDISYCTLYKYLIGDNNSWIDLGFKESKDNIKKAWGKVIAPSSNHRFIIGNTRYLNANSQIQSGIRVTPSNNTAYGPNAFFTSVDSTTFAAKDISQYQPLLNDDQFIEIHSNGGEAPENKTYCKYTITYNLYGKIVTKSHWGTLSNNHQSMNGDYNLILMGGYNNTTFAPCDNGIYVSRIYFEDINNQADPNNPNYDLPGVGMPLDLVPCQLNRDIDGSLAFDGQSHSAGECGFVNFFNGKFYGSTTATKGFSVSNY